MLSAGLVSSYALKIENCTLEIEIQPDDMIHIYSGASAEELS